MKHLNAYLIFNGNCREAMKFYEKCLGGVLYLSTYADAPTPEGVPPLPKEHINKIIHARLTVKTLVLMASDCHPGMSVSAGDNFFVSVNCESAEEAEQLFKGLGEKGKADMPLQETFFAHRFGMLTDRFGIKWMFNFEKK